MLLYSNLCLLAVRYEGRDQYACVSEQSIIDASTPISESGKRKCNKATKNKSNRLTIQEHLWKHLTRLSTSIDLVYSAQKRYDEACREIVRSCRSYMPFFYQFPSIAYYIKALIFSSCVAISSSELNWMTWSILPVFRSTAGHTFASLAMSLTMKLGTWRLWLWTITPSL